MFFHGESRGRKNGKPGETLHMKFTGIVAQRAHAAKRVLMAAQKYLARSRYIRVPKSDVTGTKNQRYFAFSFVVKAPFNLG